MTFYTSHHARVRMQQRGRRQTDVDFVLEYGTETSEGIILSNKDASVIERQARKMIERAHRLRGTYIPIAGDVVKTVFKASPHQQRRYL